MFMSEQELSRKARKKLLKQKNKEEKAKLRESKAKSKKTKTISFIVIVVVIMAAIFIFAFNRSGPGIDQKEQLDDFVTCLAESGAKMYGAYWCPHCADQKEAMGKSFSLFDDLGGYVECDPKGKDAQPSLCKEKGITGYPTWIINDQKYPGFRELSELSELTTCPI